MSACLEKSRDGDASADAEGGSGKPARRAGLQAPDTGEGRRPQGECDTRYAPLPRWPVAGVPFWDGSYIHAVRRVTWRRQSCTKGVH